MTTTPIGPPAPAIDQGAPGTPGMAGGGDVFLALVQGLLDAQSAPVPVRPNLPASDAAGPGTEDAVPGPPGLPGQPGQPGDSDDQAVDLALLDPTSGCPLAPGLVPTLVPGLVAPAPRTGAAEAGAPTDAVDAVDGVDAVAGAPATTATTATTGAPGPAAAVAAVAPATGSGVPTAPAGPRLDRSDTARADVPALDPVGPAPDQPATDRPAAAAPSAVAPAPGATSGVTATPVVGGPTAPATTVGTAPAAATGPVARQVFPEVVRLTTSTEGPQRVTIRLNPESLGEVRVVLTERRGVLEVSLSAGSEARRALLEGTPELQRLLDAVGRGDSRIVVRDGTGLPVPASSAGSSTGPSAGQAGPGTSWSSDLSGGAGTGAGRNGADAGPDQDRRPTSGSSNATDGIPAATIRSRTTETVTGARPGLDVTM